MSAETKVERIHVGLLDGIPRPKADGAYVYYADYATLERSLAAKEAECDRLREDSERYAMLFRDSWNGRSGIAVFEYRRSHDDYERLGIADANFRLDVVRAARREGT